MSDNKNRKSNGKIFERSAAVGIFRLFHFSFLSLDVLQYTDIRKYPKLIAIIHRNVQHRALKVEVT